MHGFCTRFVPCLCKNRAPLISYFTVKYPISVRKY
nr:MAG TPA: hypothetical protein [Caudoviricetes sp.]